LVSAVIFEAEMHGEPGACERNRKHFQPHSHHVKPAMWKNPSIKTKTGVFGCRRCHHAADGLCCSTEAARLLRAILLSSKESTHYLRP